MAKFANILETVGNTPVVKINRLAPPGVVIDENDVRRSHLSRVGLAGNEGELEDHVPIGQ